MNKKTIFIAGAGKGIGKAIAELAYEHKHKVIAVSRTANDLKDLPYTTIVADLSNPESIKILQNENLTDTDTVINSTGTHLSKQPLSQDWESEYIRLIKENTLPAINLYQIFLPQFRAKNKGHFVHISSAALDFYDSSEYAYCASKSALESLVLCLQNEDKKTSILHHALRVSLTNTPLARRAFPDISTWDEFYTAKETASYLLDIIENPGKYPTSIVKIPIRPTRNIK